MVLHVTTSAPARGPLGKSPHEGGSGSPWPGWVDLLAQVPLFRELPKRSLKRVARLAHLRWYADGWTVVRAGTSGDAFYAILDGHAQVHTPDGDTRSLGSDDFFGELALLDDAPRTATVTSNGGLTVARIARADFAQLLREDPAIALGLARGLVAVVRDVEARHAGTPGAARGARSGHALAQDTAAGEPPGRGGGTGDDEADSHTAGDASRPDLVAVLAGIPLFEPLNKRHLRRVARLGESTSYEAGATLARAGVRGEAFYVILDGAARVETPDGHEHTLGPRDFFGEFALLDGAPRSATVTATAPLTALRIGRPDFEKLLRADPAIAAGLARGLAAIVRDLTPAEPPKGSPRR
jgi:CRP-like cAMP-binding protein